jgi:hypothetical protein
MVPGVFFARDGAKPADDSEPALAETEVATSLEVVSFPRMSLINKTLALAGRWWWRPSRAMIVEDTGEIRVGLDTFAFKSWRPTTHWLLRPDGPPKDLEIELSAIESVRLDRLINHWWPVVILQYRTADGGSDEVWFCGSRVRKLQDAIAARLARR